VQTKESSDRKLVKMKSGQKILTIRKSNPRRNLPIAISNKRSENNFVLAFARSFVEVTGSSVLLAARELHLPGYGIADLVCLLEKSNRSSRSTNSLSTSNVNSFLAFEVKMRDWRGALSQAFRYKYYANTSIVVLPPKDAQLAHQYIYTFKTLGIGLWAFDKATGTITRHFTPGRQKPMSSFVNRKAIHLLSDRYARSRQYA